MKYLAIFILSFTLLFQSNVTELTNGQRLSITCSNGTLVVYPVSKSAVDVSCSVDLPTSTATTTSTNTPTNTPTISPTSTVTPIPTASTNVVTVQPTQSIQNVINNAAGATTINLVAGTYKQDIIINKPNITIVGTKDSIIIGNGAGRVIEVQENNTVLDGFTVDGLNGTSYRDKLIYVTSRKVKTPLIGLVIKNMTIQHAGGECVRLRYYIQGAEITKNTVQYCGQDDFKNDQYLGGSKNGEGIYIGTAPEQRSDGKNPDSSVDLSTNNHIAFNTIATHGNECVDIKEGSEYNIVENNACSFQLDSESGGFDSRGNNNTFKNNTITSVKGAIVRFGGDTTDQGINNSFINNMAANGTNGGVKIMRWPQLKICGNSFTNVSGGATTGTYKDKVNPSQACT